MRTLMDLALLQVMQDGLLRRSGEVTSEAHAHGSGRLHVVRSKTDQAAERLVLYLGSAAVEGPAGHPAVNGGGKVGRAGGGLLSIGD